MHREIKPHTPIYRAATLDVDSEDERAVTFVASDESVDRYGDVIEAEGWQLKAFRQNPIVLWQHNYAAPIGNAEPINVKGDKLLARVKFAAAGVSRIADEAWALVKAGVLRAVSVGFTVTGEDSYEYILDDDGRPTGGIRYLKPELLELSLVSVPANPNALALARSLNLSPAFVRSALPLDASVTSRQVEIRTAIQSLRVASFKHSAPR